MNKADTNSLISDYLYHLRAGGKRLSVAESGPATTSSTTGYTHDDAGRLTQESGAYGTIAYGYDNVGNRLTRTVSGSATPALANSTTVNTYDANDRLTSGAHSYDFDGNELLVNGVQASYDFENHLVQLGTRDYTAYAYDADGNRLSVSTRLWAPAAVPAGAVAGTTTFYLVDPAATYARVVLESIGGYSPTRYEYGDDLLRMVGTGGASSYYLYDGLGSTRQLTDANGVVTDGYLYDAFGVGLARTGSTVNSFLFQGQQYDAASGAYYLRARYYDQNSGRFISQDPLAGSGDDPASLHRYLYASGDPVNRFDPGGQSDSLVDTAFSMGISAALGSSLSFLAVKALGGDAGQSLEAAIYGGESGAALAYSATTGKLGITFLAGILGSFTATTVDILAHTSKDQPNAAVIALDLIEGFGTASASVAFGYGVNSLGQGLIAGGFTLAQDTVDHLVSDYDFDKHRWKDKTDERFWSQFKISIGDSVAATIIGMTAALASNTPFSGRIVQEAKQIAEKMSADEISEKVITTVFGEVQYSFSALTKYFDVQNDASFEEQKATDAETGH